MKDAILHIQDLELRHPSEGVGTLNLKIKGGEGLVVLGRNGSGKSTLLKTMAGLIRPVKGRILLSGQDVGTMSPRDRARDLALVFSTPPHDTPLTVRDVLELALDAGGSAFDDDALGAAMERGRIASWADMPMGALSDGMAQRVMMVRAFVQARSWVLMDEPTAFLDIVARREFMDDVGRWCEEGKSVVLATHDLEAVEQAGWAHRWLLVRPPAQGGSILMDRQFNAEEARGLLLSQA